MQKTQYCLLKSHHLLCRSLQQDGIRTRQLRGPEQTLSSSAKITSTYLQMHSAQLKRVQAGSAGEQRHAVRRYDRDLCKRRQGIADLCCHLPTPPWSPGRLATACVQSRTGLSEGQRFPHRRCPCMAARGALDAVSTLPPGPNITYETQDEAYCPHNVPKGV